MQIREARRAQAEIQDPNSRSYHHWLTPEEYAAQFGASREVEARVASWLRSTGLTVDGPARTGTRLAFHGTADQVERAFQTEVHRYEFNGAIRFALSVAPSIPADVAQMVSGLHGFDDFGWRARLHRVRPLYAFPYTGPDGGTAEFPILAPADFAKIYDLDTLYTQNITGAGQSVAIVGRSDFNDADIQAFRSTFGLPSNPPSRILVPSTGPATVTESIDETELDLEWAGAVAPDATLQYVFTGGGDRNVFDAMLYAIEQRIAPVLSVSYVTCEEWFAQSDVALLEMYGDAAALEGITVVAASGDTGAAGCDSQYALTASYGRSVSFPSSIPSVVAVGGTQFQLTASNQSTYLDGQLDAVSYIPESGWNETLEDIDAGYGGLGASGGGSSALFAKPSWQAAGTPNDSSRDVPDTALSASADTLPYAVSISWTAADGDAEAPQPEALTAFGGTSVAAPSFAGILALVNQALARSNPGSPVGLGNANPMLYALAKNPGTQSAFHDITIGDNIVPCQHGSPDCPSSPPYQFGYVGGPGYDQVTGLGTIDAANLVAAWSALTPTSTMLQVTPSGTTEGSPVRLVATVLSNATGNAMGGTVAFYYLASGDSGVAASATLGTVPITPITTGLQRGSASLMTMIPGGLNGAGVKLTALYGGDPHYLSSWSLSVPAAGASDLSMCPTAITLAAGQTGFTFVTSGGMSPIRWSTYADTTCAQGGDSIVCSTVDGGAFAAGPTAGSVTVVASDQYDSYVTAQVTVTDAGADGAVPLPAVSCSKDAGDNDAGDNDAATNDAASDANAGSRDSAMDGTPEFMDGDASQGRMNSGGCGCVTAGVIGDGGTLRWSLLLVLGGGCLVSRRRRPR